MTEGGANGGQKTRYKVTCHDHDGFYHHLTTGTPQMCEHCGSENIDREELEW